MKIAAVIAALFVFLLGLLQYQRSKIKKVEKKVEQAKAEVEKEKKQTEILEEAIVAIEEVAKENRVKGDQRSKAGGEKK